MSLETFYIYQNHIFSQTLEHPYTSVAESTTLLSVNVIVWKVVPSERDVIYNIWVYQQVGICTDDVISALDYLYMNKTELNKPINVYNIVYNEWK